MELEPEEKALVESYLRTSTDTHRRWLLEMVAGALSCVAAVFFLLLGLKPSIALLGFVLGLVVMAHGLDDRKRTIVTRIIHKYDRALRGGGAEQQGT